jgi:tetratricopeptide (TPR) repeat protein
MKRAILVGISAMLLCAPTAKASATADGPQMGAEGSLDKGLWWLYQLQYDKARAEFDVSIKTHPKDPAGYFYLTAVDWWHLAQDIEYDLPEVRQQLAVDSARTIEVADALYDTASDPETKAKACLYRGGAEGLWGRWLVTQREWVKAYFAGKRGHAQLKKALDLNPNLYDAYMGLGIYDYYTDTMSGVQAVLAALLIHGDKARGLKELQLAIDKSPHARVEAMCFLVEIYTSEENTPEKALPLADALRQEFPQSPGMYLIKVSTLYTMKDWHAVLPEAEDLLRKAEEEKPWYSRQYVAPARYCIGIARFFGKKDLDGAMEEMEKILAQEKDISRWVSFAHLRRGQIYDLRGEREKALADYQKALEGPDLWGLHDETQRYLKDPFKF